MAFFAQRPLLAVLLSVCAVLAFGAGASQLSINSDNRILFSETDENRRALDLFEARYGSDSNLIVALHANDGDIFTEERIALLHQLTEDAWELEHATRVDSIVNAIEISSGTDGVVVGDLAHDDSGAGAGLVDFRRRALSDPLIVGRILAPDARTTAINIRFDYPVGDATAPRRIIDAVKSMAETAGVADAGFELWLGGRVRSSDAFSTAAKTDMKTITPAAYVIIFVLVGWLLRSPAAAFSLFVAVTFSTVSAMGLAGWMGVDVNAATASAPTIILTLGVATLIHIVTAVQARLAVTGDRRQAAAEACTEIATPVALALFTTAVGFATLNFAESPPFKDLGNITAAGALFCLFYGFLLLPALLALTPISPGPENSLTRRMAQAGANFVLERRRALLFACPAVFAALSAGVFLINVDDNFIRFFDHRYEYRQESENIERHLTGLDVIEFDIGGPADALFDPAYFQKLDAFEAWLAEQPKVVHVTSISETFKRLNQHMGDGAPSSHIIPNEPADLVDSMLLYELSTPFGKSLTDTVTVNKDRSRMTVVMRKASTKDVRTLKDNAEAWLAATEPTVYVGAGTGLAVMYAYLSSVNIDAMTTGTLAALAFITIFLTISFRSAKYGAISILPNILPVALAFGVWGYFAGTVGVTASAVGAATLGIIVDDTVHLMWRYLRTRRDGASAEESVRAMFNEVGRPMATSTLALVVGFAVIATSGFQITSHLGALCALTITFALLADWFFLPALLLAVDSRARAKVETPASLSEQPA